MKAPAKTTLERQAAAQKALAEANRFIATLQTRRSDALVAAVDR
jgi:hypothetical protein